MFSMGGKECAFYSESGPAQRLRAGEPSLSRSKVKCLFYPNTTQETMAGHSKWANIQHRKGRQDAKRGKLWTKIIREITVAARAGGADPDANPRLRMV